METEFLFDMSTIRSHQTDVNRLLASTVKRLPKRIKRNPNVMGQLNKHVWERVRINPDSLIKDVTAQAYNIEKQLKTKT